MRLGRTAAPADWETTLTAWPPSTTDGAVLSNQGAAGAFSCSCPSFTGMRAPG